MLDIISRPYSKEGEEAYDRIFKKSACCNAPVTIEGHTTLYYVCTKCKRNCDTKK